MVAAIGEGGGRERRGYIRASRKRGTAGGPIGGTGICERQTTTSQRVYLGFILIASVQKKLVVPGVLYIDEVAAVIAVAVRHGSPPRERWPTAHNSGVGVLAQKTAPGG